MNATDFGIPQHRERLFIISIRKDLDDFTSAFNEGFGNPEMEYYPFPIKQPLNYRLKDFLEQNVSEKYMLSKRQISYLLNNDEKIYHYSPKNDNSPKIQIIGNISKKGCHESKAVINANGIIPTILAHMGASDNDPDYAIAIPLKNVKTFDSYNIIFKGLAIRKITPLECWRLMGFDDSDFKKAQAIGESDRALYKQAGNSIVVNVLQALFNSLIKYKIL